jgi:hypothetical protein
MISIPAEIPPELCEIRCERKAEREDLYLAHFNPEEAND